MPRLKGREVVIVEAVRTPIGRGHPEKGWYRGMHATELLGAAYRELFDRTHLDAAAVDRVLAGCVQQIGEQAMNVARNAWLAEGLPIETAATTVDLQCGSAQQAVNIAVAQIAAGVHDVVVGAGVEHMGHVSFGVGAEVADRYGGPYTPAFFAKHDVQGQGIGAELIADDHGFQREELDALAVASHSKAAAATDAGLFARELVPISVDGQAVTTDQGIRPGTTMEALAGLKPAFRPEGRITAGNSSQISDGAAAVLLMSGEKAEELGLRPRARVVDQATVGCDPVRMLEGPMPATEKVMARANLAIDDFDYVEVNEAFAPVVAAWLRRFHADPARVNPRGGAMALGHPLGSTGARLITTLLHELEDDDKELGLVTMCCGGGLGTATVIQRV